MEMRKSARYYLVRRNFRNRVWQEFSRFTGIAGKGVSSAAMRVYTRYRVLLESRGADRLERLHDGCASILHVHLVEDVLQMFVHRPRTDAEDDSHLAVALSPRQPVKELRLTIGQAKAAPQESGCRRRIRFTAGTIAEVPASPIPPGSSELCTMCTSTSGASFIRRIW